MDALFHLDTVEVGRTAAQRRTLRGAIVAAVALHALVLGILIFKPHPTPVRVSLAPSGPMTAYIQAGPAPAATTGVKRTVTPKPKKVMPAKVAEPQPVSNESTGGESAGAGPLAQGSGPVRIGAGQLQLLKRVEPLYPQMMLAARQSGTVVLDAVIRPDGTVDEVKVLQSHGPAFDRAAMDAVRQWRYSPPGYEAVLTVTVIFSLHQ